MKEAQKRNRYFLYKQSSPVHSFILLYIIPSIILHPFSTHLSFIHHPLHPSSKLSSMINLLYIIPFLNIHFKTRNNFADFSTFIGRFQLFLDFFPIYLSVWKRSIPNYFRAIIFSVLFHLSIYHISIYLSIYHISTYLSIYHISIYLSIYHISLYLSIFLYIFFYAIFLIRSVYYQCFGSLTFHHVLQIIIKKQSKT